MAITGTSSGIDLLNDLVPVRIEYSRVAAVHAHAARQLWHAHIAPSMRSKYKHDWNSRGLINFRTSAERSNGAVRTAVTLRRSLMTSKDVFVDVDRFERDYPGHLFRLADNGWIDVRALESDHVHLDPAVYPDIGRAFECVPEWAESSGFGNGTLGACLDMVLRLNVEMRRVRSVERRLDVALSTWIHEHSHVTLPGVLGVPLTITSFGTQRPLRELFPMDMHTGARRTPEDYASFFCAEPSIGNVRAFLRDDAFDFTCPDTAAYTSADVSSLGCLRDGHPEPSITAFARSSAAMAMCVERDRLEWSRT